MNITSMDKSKKQEKAIEIVSQAVKYDMNSDYANAIQCYNLAVALLNEVLAGMNNFSEV